MSSGRCFCRISTNRFRLILSNNKIFIAMDNQTVHKSNINLFTHKWPQGMHVLHPPRVRLPRLSSVLHRIRMETSQRSLIVSNSNVRSPTIFPSALHRVVIKATPFAKYPTAATIPSAKHATRQNLPQLLSTKAATPSNEVHQSNTHMEMSPSHRTCTVDSPTKTSLSVGLCASHRGGKRCSVNNCLKRIVSKGLCRSHGGI